MFPAIGYAIHEQDGSIFDDPDVNGAEIVFAGWRERGRLAGRLQSVGFDYVSVHPVENAVAGGNAPTGDYLEALKRIAGESGARSVSDRCCPTRGNRGGTRQPPRTATELDATCRRVEANQAHFGEARFYLDHPLRRPTSRSGSTESEFLSSVLRRTGCGWLLDVTEVYITGLNEGIDPYEFVEEVAPAAEQVQMHLSGVRFDWNSERFVESPAHPIPQPVLDLYEFALDEAEERVAAVFIDRNRSRADVETCRQEVQVVREIAESAAALSSAC